MFVRFDSFVLTCNEQELRQRSFGSFLSFFTLMNVNKAIIQLFGSFLPEQVQRQCSFGSFCSFLALMKMDRNNGILRLVLGGRKRKTKRSQYRPLVKSKNITNIKASDAKRWNVLPFKGIRLLYKYI